MLKFRAVLLAAPAMMVFVAGAFAQVSPTLKKIQDRGAIVIGHRESSVPFSHIDQNQKPVGFTVDLCLKIADAVKDELKKPDIKINYVPVAPQTRFALLANGTIDLECGSTTNTFSRQSQAAFTFTTFITGTKIMVRKDSRIASVDDLRGKTLVVLPGTTNIKQLTEANAARSLNINIIPAKDHAEAFLMVETDRAVAFVMDDILLASLIAGSKAPDDYVISKDAFSKPEPYGIMLRKDDPAFKKVVDAATAALYTGGEGQKIYDKWFTQKIPPKGLNLNVPIGSELKNEFAKPSDSPDPDSYK